MSDWLKKQLERDRTYAEIDAARRQILVSKGPALWQGLQNELKECVEMFRAQYPEGAAFERLSDEKIEIRRPGSASILEMTYDRENFKIPFVLRNQAGTNEGVLDIDLNDRKECCLRQGMERYETLDDVSAILLRPLLYG
jgi:hypothetical protein